jgi:hypothetical protein
VQHYLIRQQEALVNGGTLGGSEERGVLKSERTKKEACSTEIGSSRFHKVDSPTLHPIYMALKISSNTHTQTQACLNVHSQSYSRLTCLTAFLSRHHNKHINNKEELEETVIRMDGAYTVNHFPIFFSLPPLSLSLYVRLDAAENVVALRAEVLG